MNCKVVKFKELDSEMQDIIIASKNITKMAFCPYSKFAVGAAIYCQDGSVFTGCNVENSSFGLTICAERTAAVKAVSEGHRDFAAIAIAIEDLKCDFVTPCGACRQFLNEFNSKMMLYMPKAESDDIFVACLTDLLPFSFSFKS